MIAVREDDAPLATILIDAKANINAQDDLHHTLLHRAVQKNSIKVMRLLLNAQANPNLVNIHQQTPLECVLQRIPDFHQRVNSLKLDTPMVKPLLAAKANVETPDQTGTTPLRHAISINHMPLLRTLIQHNANVNASPSPLLCAIENECPEAIHILLAAGSNVNQKDNDGTTPLLKIVKKITPFNEHSMWIDRKLCISMMHTLIFAGANNFTDDIAHYKGRLNLSDDDQLRLEEITQKATATKAALEQQNWLALDLLPLHSLPHEINTLIYEYANNIAALHPDLQYLVLNEIARRKACYMRGESIYPSPVEQLTVEKEPKTVTEISEEKEPSPQLQPQHDNNRNLPESMSLLPSYVVEHALNRLTQFFTFVSLYQ